MTKAVDILRPSKLVSQNQLMATDVELKSFSIALKGSASLSVEDAILDGNISRTIEGASTVTITLLDRDREIFRSGRLTEKADIMIDGLWFRLVNVQKRGDTLTLTFEDREVAIMRKYNKPLKIARAKLSRARFIKRMVNEVKEIKIPFVCPEIDQKQAVTTKLAVWDYKIRGNDQYARNPGFGVSQDITVNGIPASLVQINNTDRVLKVGASRGAARNVMIAAIETINVESSATNIPGGDRDSVGIFQQRPSQGWGTVEECMNIEHASNSFFDRAIPIYNDNPSALPGTIAQGVQRSAYPDKYEKRREEAERTLSRWGYEREAGGRPDDKDGHTMGPPAPDVTKSKGGEDPLVGATAAEMQAAMKEAGATGGSTEYEFQRGVFLESGVKRENTWECSGRLAEEVNWRRFMVSGTFYYMSEKRLFRAAPVMRISEETEGVNAIDATYDVGRVNGSVSITCRIGRWAAPPGSIVEIFDCGTLNGRWLVSEIDRSLFSTEATITVKKPRPKLAEPTTDQEDQIRAQYGLVNESGGQETALGGSYKTGGAITRPIPHSSVPSRSTHNTDGLPGYPAYDIMTPGGTDVIAPESGSITRISGHSPAIYDGGAIMGYSVYFEGDSGTRYFMTHMGKTAQEGRYIVGAKIGQIAEWPGDPGRSHLHFAINEAGPLTFADFSKALDVSK